MKPVLASFGAAVLCAFLLPVVSRAEPPGPAKITGSVPVDYFRPALTRVRWGKEIRFTVTATIATDADPVVVTGPLPGGAEYQPATRVFRWIPTHDQVGQHSVEFAIAGDLAEKRTVRLEVGENRPPVVTITSPLRLRAGHTVTLHPQTDDPDGDPVTCQILDLPRGATVTHPERCYVEWPTTEADAGPHRLTLAVSDGSATTSKTIEVSLEENWESYLLPGVYYGFYRPVSHASYGTFHGTTLELVIASWIHRNDNHGPSHGRVSLKVDLLSSTQDGQPVAFLYAAGLDLSLERNPLRRWLVPFFGADVGGLTQRNMHHQFQVTPRAGVYIWTNRNFFVTLAGGYMLVPGKIEELRGWRAGLGCNLTLW